MKLRLLISGLIFLFATSCNGFASLSKPETPEPSVWPTQRWQSSTPEQQGMDSGKLADMFAAIQTQGIKLHSLLIVRNGYLVTESYWQPYGPNDKHTIESNTKSIVGTLIGIAIDQGSLQSVDQKLVDFFPERPIRKMDEQKKSITLQNLLSMTPGLDCQDLSSAGTGMYQASNWVQYLLDLPVTSPPGTRWIYCSGAAHLLSAVLQKTTGTDARTYANRNLFEPLGIPEVQEQDWNTDPQSVTNGIAGLYLTPRDLAKYGYLYLNKGRWDGRQVVSARWVAESTREQAFIGKDDYVGGLDRRFGYLWSIFPEQKYYGYLGMAGQELYVLPEKNMVVVFTASLGVGKEALLLKLVNDYIVPAVISDQPIAPLKEATARLQGYQEAAAESKRPPAPLPQIALDISGKTYRLEQNPLGWQSMTFFFQPGADEAVLRMADTQDLKIGLDNIYRFSESPNSRPVGLRGAWKTANEFYLEYVTLGDFSEAAASIEFGASQIDLSMTSLNFGGPPQRLHGAIQK